MRTVTRHMSIGRRLTLAFGLIGVLLVVVAGAGLYGALTQQSLRSDMGRLQALREDVQELRYLDADISGWQGYIFSEALIAGPEVALDPEAYNMSGLLESKAAVYDLLEVVDTGSLTAREKTTFEQMTALWDDYFRINDQMFAELDKDSDAGNTRANDLLNDELDTAWSDLLAATEKIAASVDRRIDRLGDRSDAAAGTARTSIYVAVALALLAAVGMGIVVTRSIVRPLRRCVGALAEVAAGDLTASPGVAGRDEVGRLAASLDEAMGSVRGIVATMADSATHLASTAGELAGTATTIAGSAQETSTQAQVVSGAADEVSRTVQTVAAGSEQMGASIQEIARSTNDAVLVASEAVSVVEATSVTVGKLGESSTEIGNVIKVITAIADQTNLLALNATIEAARAGAAGRGFAVVAQEVKDLAQQTAAATGDIAGRVEAIQGDAAGAVRAIHEIADVIARISDSQTTIASAVEEQTATTREMNRHVADAATSSGEIAANIGSVAGASQVTTHGVQDLNAAVAQLSRMSGELQTLVSRFRY